MTSHRSNDLYTQITFQGQESRMQVTGMALWTKSRWVLIVFSTKLSYLASQNLL